MSIKEKILHKVFISLGLSVLVWSIINLIIIDLSFTMFIFIQIVITISNFISNFIKDKFNLATVQQHGKQ